MASFFSLDGKEYKIDRDMAVWGFGVFNEMEEHCEDSSMSQDKQPIMLTTITGEILQNLIRWCEFNYKHSQEETLLMEWNDDFFSKFQFSTLCEVTKGADFLDMKALLSLCIKSLATRLSGKSSVKELRQLLGLVENHSPDEYNLTNMIPVDIWRLVLDNVPVHFLPVVINCSLFLRDLRKQELAKDLFHHVYPLLAQKYGEKTVKLLPAQSEPVQEPNMTPLEWKLATLQLRLVCSSWNKVVETNYENRIWTFPAEYYKNYESVSRLHSMKLNWLVTKKRFQVDAKWPWSIASFFHKTHGSLDPRRNPLLGRAVVFHFEISNVRHALLYVFSIIEMLRDYGEFIWYCDIAVKFLANDLNECVRLLQRILSLMPNLMHLCVHRLDENDNLCTTEELAVGPFPKLEKLEALVLVNMDNQLFLGPIMQNGHITTLIAVYCSIPTEAGVYLTNIKQFAAVTSCGGETMIARCGHEWKLEKCVITESVYPCVRRVFNHVHNWSESLTHLQIEYPFPAFNYAMLMDTRFSRLHFPNLITAVLLNNKSFYLDFLLPVRNSLKHIEMVDNSVEPDIYYHIVSSDQFIQVCGFERDMKTSNIWTIFPCLKTVKLWTGKNDNVIHKRNDN